VSTHEQLGRAFFPMPGGPHFLTAALTDRDVCHWQAAVFYSAIPEWFAASVARTDPAARGDLANSLGVLADEVGMVREYPCPIGLIQGQYERTVRLPYLESLGLESKLWRNAIQVVDESNHFTQYDARPRSTRWWRRSWPSWGDETAGGWRWSGPGERPAASAPALVGRPPPADVVRTHNAHAGDHGVGCRCFDVGSYDSIDTDEHGHGHPTASVARALHTAARGGRRRACSTGPPGSHAAQ
jgi:hypothetical protein